MIVKLSAWKIPCKQLTILLLPLLFSLTAVGASDSLSIFLDETKGTEERNKAIFSISHSHELTNKVPVKLLEKSLDDPNPLIRRHVAHALRGFRGEKRDLVRLLQKAIRNSDWYTQRNGVESALQIGKPAADVVPDVGEFIARSQDGYGLTKALEFLRIARSTQADHFATAAKLIESRDSNVASAAERFIRSEFRYTKQYAEVLARFQDRLYADQWASYLRYHVEPIEKNADPKERLYGVLNAIEKLEEYRRSVPKAKYPPDLEAISEKLLSQKGSLLTLESSSNAPSPNKSVQEKWAYMGSELTEGLDHGVYRPEMVVDLAGVPLLRFRSGEQTYLAVLEGRDWKRVSSPFSSLVYDANIDKRGALYALGIEQKTGRLLLSRHDKGAKSWSQILRSSEPWSPTFNSDSVAGKITSSRDSFVILSPANSDNGTWTVASLKTGRLVQFGTPLRLGFLGGEQVHLNSQGLPVISWRSVSNVHVAEYSGSNWVSWESPKHEKVQGIHVTQNSGSELLVSYLHGRYSDKQLYLSVYQGRGAADLKHAWTSPPLDTSEVNIVVRVSPIGAAYVMIIPTATSKSPRLFKVSKSGAWTEFPYFPWRVQGAQLAVSSLEESPLIAFQERERLFVASLQVPTAGSSITDLWKKIKSSNLGLQFSPQELSALAGVPIFLSGPHANSFDLKNIQSFGHYNPAFLEWAKRIAIPRDGEYFRLTSPIFEKFLSQHLGSLLQARYYLHANPKRFQEILSKYKSALQSKKIFAPMEVIPFGEKQPVDSAYLAFWIRRQIDGTSQIVQELLELAMEAYFPSGLQHLRRQLRASPYAITMLGSYHGEEVQFENGEKAFGLYIDDGRSVLKSHIVDIERVHDAIADNNGQKTGKLVTLRGEKKAPAKQAPSQPVYLFKGSLSDGPVSVVKAPSLSQCAERPCRIKFGTRNFSIKVAHSEKVLVEAQPETYQMKYLLEVGDGGSTQVIPSVKEIIWAGDLDRDGKLDLIYDDSFHYNVMRSLHLLLSSPAKLTPLIEVASFQSVGC